MYKKGEVKPVCLKNFLNLCFGNHIYILNILNTCKKSAFNLFRSFVFEAVLPILYEYFFKQIKLLSIHYCLLLYSVSIHLHVPFATFIASPLLLHPPKIQILYYSKFMYVIHEFNTHMPPPPPWSIIEDYSVRNAEFWNMGCRKTLLLQQN